MVYSPAGIEAFSHLAGERPCPEGRLKNLVVMGDLDHLILSGRDYRAEITDELAELAEYRRRFGGLEKHR